MKRILAIITALVASLSLMGMSACSHKHDDPEEHAEWIIHKATKKLDLDQTQQGKLVELKDTLLAIHKEKKSKHPQMKAEMIQMLDQPVLDQQHILNKFDEHVTEIRQHLPLVVEKLAGFYDSLNEEQRSTLKKMAEKHNKGHSHSWRS